VGKVPTPRGWFVRGQWRRKNGKFPPSPGDVRCRDRKTPEELMATWNGGAKKKPPAKKKKEEESGMKQTTLDQYTNKMSVYSFFFPSS
jgi:hypothetical protein